MPASTDFSGVFAELRNIMNRYGKKLSVVHDTPVNYYVNGFYSEKFKKEIMFGAVQIKKNYVSYHLMPLYIYAEMKKAVPPELKKRMQGKSCFNFTKIDKALFKELNRVTETGYDLFVSKKDKVTMKC
jgi:hypothetical protein